MTDQHDSSELSAQFAASTEELVALYDSWSPSYDDDVSSWGYEVPETVAAMLGATVLQTTGPSAEILDAGCGTGRTGAALRATGFATVIGIDFSTDSLALAGHRNAYAALVHGDLNKPLPFDDDQFAGVASAGVFTYLQEPEPVIRELVRVTQPGGVVIFSQRTDLWDPRDTEASVGRVEADGLASAEFSDPQPYLPGHPEYGKAIKVIYTRMQVR